MPRLTICRRALFLLSLVGACAAGEADLGRPGLSGAPGIHVDAESSGTTSGGSTGPGSSSGGSSSGDLPGDVSSSGTGEASTGAALLEETTTGGEPGEASTGGSSSTGDVELGTSTGGESSGGEAASSTGEPPAVCGDGVCEPSERAPCWAVPKESWCFQDCYTAPECESDCPCTAAAAAVKNFCNADPKPACAATAPGGYCSQGDDVQGFYAWHAKCG